MFPNPATHLSRNYRLAVVGLSLLSAAALAITIWMLVDFLKEQTIVDGLIQDLPRGEKGPAEYLAGELRWQFRLTILVVINVIVTAIAVILLWRAYHASQTSLRDFKALASDVLSGMEQGVITTNGDGNITSINRRASELLEVDATIAGKPLGNIQAIPLKQYRDDWLADRPADTVRDFTIHRSGHTRILRAFCQALSDHEGNEVGNVLQVRDVTERFLIDERMRRMQRYMGLGSLAGGLHHEIKNPLAALSLHVQLLEEQLDADGTSDDNRQLLGVIRTEVTRIGGVLEGFRDFASIDSLATKTVDMHALISRQLELMRPQADQQDIKVVFDPCRDSEAMVDADQTRLEQVVLNLIVNAMEAMPDGGILTVSTHGPDAGYASDIDESFRIEISDTGCGIPDNLVDKILDPYFTTKSNGTGLGLAISDKIIRQHVGSLDFRSSADGTTFEIRLPQSVATVAKR